MARTPREIVVHPDGRELAIVVRRRGLKPGGSDAASLALDAATAVASRVGRLGWVVEVRPWPVGRKLVSERFDNEEAAIERADRLGVEIGSGQFEP